MSAGGTIIMAGLGGVAGAYAGAVVADEFNARGSSVTHAAIGAAAGAMLGAFINVTVKAADERPQGTLSGLHNPRFP